MRSDHRLLTSSSFRITLAYLALLCLLIAGIGVSIYWSTTAAVTRQIESTVDAELTGLREQFRQRGLLGLVRAIERRVQDNQDSRALYLLTDQSFRPLAGNLTRWPDGQRDAAGWLTFRMENPGTPQGFDFGRARTFDLGGFHLLVGHDVREETYVGSLIRGTLIWSLLLIMAVTLLGGILLTRHILSRIDAINRTSREIMAGDLARRVPEGRRGDEFDALAHSLNAMLSRIERLVEGMRQVSDNIAHDLRSPLSRLRSRLELALLEARDPDSDRELIEKTIAETDHLLNTFNALLSIAEAESGAPQDRFEMLDLIDLLKDLAELYGPLFDDAGMAFDLDCETGTAASAPIRGDRNLLFQALANLLDNAMRHGSGPVALSLKTQPGEFVVCVLDRGPGIPEEAREKVLGRFFRVDSSRSSQGSGLGLSLANAVAGLHGGRLRLEDANPGLRVLLLLPSD